MSGHAGELAHEAYPDTVNALVPEIKWPGLVCDMLVESLFNHLLNSPVACWGT